MRICHEAASLSRLYRLHHVDTVGAQKVLSMITEKYIATTCFTSFLTFFHTKPSSVNSRSMYEIRKAINKHKTHACKSKFLPPRYLSMNMTNISKFHAISPVQTRFNAPMCSCVTYASILDIANNPMSLSSISPSHVSMHSSCSRHFINSHRQLNQISLLPNAYLCHAMHPQAISPYRCLNSYFSGPIPVHPPQSPYSSHP